MRSDPLILPPSVDAEVVHRLKADMLARLAADMPVPADFRIDGSGVERIGTPGLQFLCAARRSAENLGRELRLNAPSEALSIALATAAINFPVVEERTSNG